MQAEGYTGITEWTVRRLISSGQLKAIKIGKRFYVTLDAIREMELRLERRQATR